MVLPLVALTEPGPVRLQEIVPLVFLRVPVKVTAPPPAVTVVAVGLTLMLGLLLLPEPPHPRKANSVPVTAMRRAFMRCTSLRRSGSISCSSAH